MGDIFRRVSCEDLVFFIEKYIYLNYLILRIEVTSFFRVDYLDVFFGNS